MTIEKFAEKYQSRTRKDECGDTYIPGTPWPEEHYGHQIYEHSERFALLLMFPVDGGSKSAKWVHARKKLLNSGFTIKQDSDGEGVALFDPEHKIHARLALKLAGIRTRQLIPERKAALTAQLAAARAKRVV